MDWNKRENFHEYLVTFGVIAILSSLCSYFDVTRFYRWDSHDARQNPNQHCNAYRDSRRSPSTVRMKLSKWINNGKKSISRECCQCEHRNANRQVLEELGNLANELSPWPAVVYENCRRKGHLQHDVNGAIKFNDALKWTFAGEGFSFCMSKVFKIMFENYSRS